MNFFEKLINLLDHFGKWGYRVFTLISFFALMAPAIISDAQYRAAGNGEYGLLAWPVLFAVLGLTIWFLFLISLIEKRKEVQDREKLKG